MRIIGRVDKHFLERGVFAEFLRRIGALHPLAAEGSAFRVEVSFVSVMNRNPGFPGGSQKLLTGR